ncbi:hydrogenase 4 subunit F [Roseomonas sp. GC11]|uniref:proton-conducting transporter transmembrane domain-containing protein n=1 Tax=Roseomonas sp. GC11 TaxID=2950546 RepID=UPI00210BEB37|nr:proton-conducting transporter membrane subunit [Roseomonas sp. GC11]MCQ4161302.1 hydrogenase 4 subunit F [Roseomonas sp. GC11]
MPDLLIALPFLAALLLALWPSPLLNIAAALAGFLLSLTLLTAPREVEGLLLLDALNLPLVLLSAFIGLTTAIFSAAMLPAEGFSPRAARAYHAAFQAFLGANYLALLADNLGLMWAAIEGATLATVLMVALHRGAAALEAAWKFLILCGVGIALALFGTIVLGLAAQPYTGGGEGALSFTALLRVGREADPALLSLAFIFLLVGYGTKAGLAPLHSWLPDAHAEGPVAMSAVLSGLLLNAALHAILRARAVVALNEAVLPPGALMAGMGLLSLLLAALALWRRRDARRFLAWSSIEHMGLAAFAFGLGGPAALAGVLHMLGHSLVKSALFFLVGRATLLKGSQRLEDLRGLVAGHPGLGWALVLGFLAIAGLPPFSLFSSEFLMIQQSAARLPWLALPLGLGLLVAALALLRAMQALCLGPATPDARPPAPAWGGSWAVLGPAWAHLLAALVLGLALPAPLAALLAEAARIAG